MNLEVGDAALRRIFLRRTASISLEEGRSLEEDFLRRTAAGVWR